MPGIYFHIPFCKSICTYCDFYKTSDIDKIETLVSVLQKEMHLQHNYMGSKNIETIYFGGGTPSLLTQEQFIQLINTARRLFNIDCNAEITAEVNPDDLSARYLEKLLKIGINRLSIGIQSFNAANLELMKRRHTADQASKAVKAAQKAGFNNISVDLIYGLPQTNIQQWNNDLQQVFDLDIQHISAYHLTYHKKTKLWNDLKKGRIKELLEEESVKQFSSLIEQAQKHGFEHYEISNFAKDKHYSKHNTSYWSQSEYLGLGPSAHSYNIKSRQWNVAGLQRYIDAIGQNKIPARIEILSENDRFNDYVITSLRTMWGLSVAYIQSHFDDKYFEYIKPIIAKYSKSGKVKFDNNTVTLTQQGMFISDSIMADFIF